MLSSSIKDTFPHLIKGGRLHPNEFSFYLNTPTWAFPFRQDVALDVLVKIEMGKKVLITFHLMRIFFLRRPSP